MKGGGKKEKFATGAVRDEGERKTRPDLISPFSTLRKGVWMAKGGVKYAPRNWEKGIPISRCVASLYRHILEYMCGDCSEDHMAAVGVNADFIMHYEEMIKLGKLPEEKISDMPDYGGVIPENLLSITIEDLQALLKARVKSKAKVKKKG